MEHLETLWLMALRLVFFNRKAFCPQRLHLMALRALRMVIFAGVGALLYVGVFGIMLVTLLPLYTWVAQTLLCVYSIVWGSLKGYATALVCFVADVRALLAAASARKASAGL
jgi:hypothetical protein